MLGGFGFITSTLFRMNCVSVISQPELHVCFLSHISELIVNFILSLTWGFQILALWTWFSNWAGINYFGPDAGHTRSLTYADNPIVVTYSYLVNSKYVLAFCCHAALLSYFTTIYNTVQ